MNFSYFDVLMYDHWSIVYLAKEAFMTTILSEKGFNELDKFSCAGISHFISVMFVLYLCTYMICKYVFALCVSMDASTYRHGDIGSLELEQ